MAPWSRNNNWQQWDSFAVAAGDQIDGTYKDDWEANSVMVLKQTGNTLTAEATDGSWGPESGAVEGTTIKIWGLTGTLESGKIQWDNGGSWSRIDSPAPKQEEPAATAEAGGGADNFDPWKKAASALDISGTYSDPWQGNALIVFTQSGTKLTAAGPDGSWGPEQGTVRGGSIEIFGQKAKFEGGNVVWDNGNVWERVKDAAAAEEAPAQAAAAARAEVTAAAADVAAGSGAATAGDSIAGTYSDPWQNDALTVLTQQGTDLIACGGDDAWGPEYGSINGNSIELFGITGEYSEGIIRWSNGGEWPKVAPAPASAGAAATRATAKATDSWGQENAATNSAQAPNGDAGNDAQKRARWRDFKGYQDWYKENNVLPGKDPEEIQMDEERLFSSENNGEGIDFGLYDRVTCNITGPKSENIPQLTTFEALYAEFEEFLPSELVENIRKCKYKRPTPVQKFSIPAALSGRDVMCCAQTGSGKTAAFLIPILASMIKHGKATGALTVPFEGPCKPDTLVLSPTRELCLQIYDEALKFCHKTPHRCVRVYGQEQVKTQIGQLAKGGDLCVATPGRLWDFVSSGIVEVVDVQCLVLDEADRMLSMNMEGFIRDVVEKFGMPSREERQTLMFSATFPEDCQKLAQEYLFEHVFIGVGVVGGAACTVTQTLLQVAPEDKFERLIDFLNDWLGKREKQERLLVFTNSKIQAKGLDEKLYERNIDTGALHGDLQQEERETNLSRFRSGDIDVLVATDLASRGLDICGVSHVVNYDLPRECDVYVQRIGRTGRIGHRGEATTFIAVGKDGTWHDSPEVLQGLPKIMQDSSAGCDNEVPAWLTSHIEVLQRNSWVQDSNASGADNTDVRSWGEDKGWRTAGR